MPTTIGDLDIDDPDGSEPTDKRRTCTWTVAWVGECGDPAVTGTDPPRCADHNDDWRADCANCGAQATGGCEATFGLVCGAPLCDDCDLNDCPRH